MSAPSKRRGSNPPWRHIYGVDRKYTARVDRLTSRLPARGMAADATPRVSPKSVPLAGGRGSAHAQAADN